MNNTKNKQLTAACLLRVSAKKQKDNYSIPYQADVFIEEIKRYGFNANIKHLKEISEKYQGEHQIRNFRGNPLVYLEDGVSATSFNQDRSKEYSRMIKDAKSKQYDVLFAIKVDRMARDQEQSLGMVRVLNKENGIRVIIPEDRIDTDDKLWKDDYELRAWLASREGRQIKFRMEFGLKRKMKDKRRVGSCPFGYNPINDDKGKWSGFLEKNPEKAYWVVEIYKWYVFEGLSTAKITERLNERGILTKRGDKWHRTSILYLLSNETYIGRRSRKHLADKYETDIPDFICPSIISKELFKAAIKKREVNSRELRRRPKRNYFFRNKIFCGLCGGKLYPLFHGLPGREAAYYRGNEAKRCVDGKRCGSIPENILIAHIMPSIVQLCVRPELWDKIGVTTGDEQIENQIEDEHRIIDKIRKDLKQSEYGFIEGIVSKSTAKEIKRKLEPQLALHQRNIQELNQKVLSEEERRNIKNGLIHWNLSLNHKSGKDFTKQLLLIARALLNDLYVDCRKKKVIASLQISDSTHINVALSKDSIDNEEFFKRPIIERILDQAYRSYQIQKEIKPSNTQAKNIEPLTLGDCSIKQTNKKPVKYSFTINYGRTNA